MIGIGGSATNDGGIGMATTFDDPMWLVAGAVLAIATGFFMRGNSGR